MLRLVVLLLVLLNAGYYAWSQGMLRAYGWAPVDPSEAHRIQQQLRPEAVRILPPEEGRRAEQVALTPPKPPECLQAGVFDDRQAEALRAAAAGLPQGSWVLEATPVPGRWMVYMGRFDDIETLDRKRAELRARKVDHDRAGGTLELGLSLGRFASKEAAERELTNLGNKGVRTARVIQERAESPGFTLRLPAVNDALRSQLDTLRPAMAGRTLRSCG